MTNHDVRNITVVLFSGGLDSTTLLMQALSEGLNPVALSFDYGQRNIVEVQHAEKIAEVLQVPQHTLDIVSASPVFMQSSLVAASDEELPVDRDASTIEDEGRWRSSYVPLRNTLFLTLGAQLLESMVIQLLRDDKEAAHYAIRARVGIGVQWSRVGTDDSPKYLAAMTHAFKEGGRWSGNTEVSIYAPLIDLSRPKVIARAIELGAPIHMTWTCFAGGEYPCGRCDACVLRAKGFMEAGVEDPALSIA